MSAELITQWHIRLQTLICLIKMLGKKKVKTISSRLVIWWWWIPCYQSVRNHLQKQIQANIVRVYGISNDQQIQRSIRRLHCNFDKSRHSLTFTRKNPAGVASAWSNLLGLCLIPLTRIDIWVKQLYIGPLTESSQMEFISISPKSRTQYHLT